MSFFQDFQQLLMKTPRHHSPMQDCENSDYNTFLYRGRNCYMTWGSSVLEDCMYCFTCFDSKDSIDCTYCKNVELCYDCLDSYKCYHCAHSQDLVNCYDCRYCYDCLACNDCVGCVGLRRKKSHIFNKPYSKEGYLKKIKNLKPAEIEKEFEALKLKIPRIATHGQNYENCLGDYIHDSKNGYYVFDITKCEDAHYLFDEISNMKDCLDCSHTHNDELCYDAITTDNNYNCNHVFWCVNSRDCEHCFCIIGCEKCFGCTYIRNKKYHILNQPYSPKEYEKKVTEIKAALAEASLANQNLLYLTQQDLLPEKPDW